MGSRKSLRNKIIQLTLGAVLLFGLGSTLLFNVVLMRQMKGERQEKGFYIINHLAYVLEAPLLQDDSGQVEDIMNDAMAENDDIAYIFIRTPDSRVVYHTTQSILFVDLQKLNPLREGAGAAAALDFTSKGIDYSDIAVAFKNQKFGTLHVGFSNEKLLTSRKLIFVLSLAGVVGMLVLFSVLFYLFSRRLTKPLERMLLTASAIGRGDFGTPVVVESDDEIGELGHAINKMLRDLQETTVSRQQYKKQTAFLTNILESIPYPFYVVDAATYEIVMANSATGGIDEWQGKTCHQLTHHRSTPCGEGGGCLCPLVEVRKSGKPVVLEHVHLLHGQERIYEVHGFPVFDNQGQLLQIIEYSMDITSRKEAEKALEESRNELQHMNAAIEANRKQLQDALQHISGLIQKVVQDQDLSVRFDNAMLPACSEIMQCGKVECECHGKEKVRCWQVAGTYCGGERKGIFSQKIKDCVQCPVFREATTEPVMLIGEQFNNMMHVLAMQNIELQNAYAELKKAQSQMLQREKMVSIGMLAAGVAHEINNPMGYITSNLGSLQKYAQRLAEFIAMQSAALASLSVPADTVDTLEEARQKQKIDFILTDLQALVKESLEGADRVKHIVANLKTFSRLDDTSEFNLADINECLESTLAIVWNELKYKATILKDYGQLPKIYCSANQLNQVFVNLLVNAVQAIDKQGDITIRTWSDEQLVYVSVSDTGCGMDTATQHHIFEPFFTTKEVGKGTGLGMSISYDIVKKHGGNIIVESEVGKGTTFTVSIPVITDP